MIGTAYVAAYTCWCIHMLVHTHVGAYTCWCIHMSASSSLPPYVCFFLPPSLPLLPVPLRHLPHVLVGILMMFHARYFIYDTSFTMLHSSLAPILPRSLAPIFPRSLAPIFPRSLTPLFPPCVVCTHRPPPSLDACRPPWHAPFLYGSLSLSLRVSRVARGWCSRAGCRSTPQCMCK